MSEKTYQQKYYEQNRDRRKRESIEYQQANKEHRKEYMREYAINNRSKFRRTPEQQEERNRKRREKYASCKKTREQARLQSADWQERNPDKRFAQRLKKYGITPDDYYRMLNEQNGKCAICGSSDPKDGRTNKMFVDHCHGSGRVRGLLCSSCNLGIGKFRDEPELLLSAAKYIKGASAD